MNDEETRARMFREFCAWRGVETPCAQCSGSGGIVYGSTSTWRGGIGGSAMTHDVCDACWGSGDASEPWADLRAMERSIRDRIEERAAALFSESIGARFEACRTAAGKVANELDKIARKRSESDEKRRVAAMISAMLRTVSIRTQSEGR